jgi:hypothetical protein
MFATSQTITKHVHGSTSVLGGDVDGDRDLDVQSSSATDGKIAWYPTAPQNAAKSCKSRRIVEHHSDHHAICVSTQLLTQFGRCAILPSVSGAEG